MTLGRSVSFALLGTLAACGDDPVPLQVQLEWVTLCDAGGCPTRDNSLSGKPGDAIPGVADDRAELGVECEIVESGDSIVATSLKVQDRNIEVQPTLGINIRNGQINVGSSMTCPANAFELFDDNQFTGGCGTLTDGSCQILVSDYNRSRGRLVFDFDCKNLSFSGGLTRSVEQGLATFEGCNVTEDTR